MLHKKGTWRRGIGLNNWAQQMSSSYSRSSSASSTNELHCLVGAALEYLMELCHPVGSAVGRQGLRSASRGDLVVPRFGFRHSTIGPSLSQARKFGTLFCQDQTIAWQFIAFQTETESASVSAVLSASVDPYLRKGLMSFLYYYYYYYYYYYSSYYRSSTNELILLS